MMTKKIVVADSGPLIILSKTGHLPVLEKFFREVNVPAEVWTEVVDLGKGKPGSGEVSNAKWIKVRKVNDSRSVEILSHELGQGEAAAIVLASELKADLLLMDDKIPREIAKSLGLKVAGTLAIIHEAVRKRVIVSKSFEDVVDRMRKNGFWISDEIVESFKKTGK